MGTESSLIWVAFLYNVVRTIAKGIKLRFGPENYYYLEIQAMFSSRIHKKVKMDVQKDQVHQLMNLS